MNTKEDGLKPPLRQLQNMHSSSFVIHPCKETKIVFSHSISDWNRLSQPIMTSRSVETFKAAVFSVCFVDHCLSFCPFSYGHCVVYSSSIYGFWLPLWYLQTLLVNDTMNLIKIRYVTCSLVLISFGIKPHCESRANDPMYHPMKLAIARL
jgi:hypothetical protein